MQTNLTQFRKGKPSFVPLYTEHKKVMSEKFGVDLKYMTEIRQKIHSHPEGGFKEFETQKLLKDVL